MDLECHKNTSEFHIYGDFELLQVAYFFTSMPADGKSGGGMLILGWRPVNERRRYKITPSLAGGV